MQGHHFATANSVTSKKKEDPYANRFHVKETVSGTDGVAHMLDATPTHLRSKIRKLQLQPAIGRDSLW